MQDYPLVPVGIGDTFPGGDAAGQDRLRHDHRTDSGARAVKVAQAGRHRRVPRTRRARSVLGERLSGSLPLHGPRLDETSKEIAQKVVNAFVRLSG